MGLFPSRVRAPLAFFGCLAFAACGEDPQGAAEQPAGTADGGGGGASGGGSANGGRDAAGPGPDGAATSGGSDANGPDARPPADGATASPAATLVRRLGRDHFLIGLGPNESRYPITAKLDIKYIYLVGASNPANAWVKWNTPDGEFAKIVAEGARAKGAIPMFNIYEFAALGDGNFQIVRNATYMARFWSDLQILADRLKTFDAPAIVHVEPDFWGYAQQNSPGGDPTKFSAQVKINTKCADLPDDLTGLGRCAVRIFHTTSPKAIVGLHGSNWAAFDANGNPDGAAVGRFLNRCAGGEADFVGTDILDRDAGCFEVKPSQFDCGRGGTTGWYWDESNQTSPNFREYFAWSRTLVTGAGVPLMWWQTPMGVPRTTPGGAPNKYRDNRVRYMFAHMDELVAAGGFAAAFGAGASGQTTIDSDDGQFERALTAYNAAPLLLK